MFGEVVPQTLGKYRIIGEIGRGGMAVVYKAHDRALDRDVALKLMAVPLGRDPEAIQRFYAEARAVARLKHPNIVVVHDIDQVEGRPYLTMELLDGCPLCDVLRADGPLPLPRALNLLGQVASALDYAHAQGIVHRDVKPANILVDSRDHATLTDFGLVKALSGVALTHTGTLMGTPAYMSPEQVIGAPVGPASDIYSLGVVAYEMLGGRQPFGGDTPHALLYAQAHTPPPPLHTVNPQVPEHIAAVVHKALAKSPEQRFPSAGAFVNALAAAAGAPPTVKLAAKADAVGAPPRRRFFPILLVLGLAALLLLVCGGLGARYAIAIIAGQSTTRVPGAVVMGATDTPTPPMTQTATVGGTATAQAPSANARATANAAATDQAAIFRATQAAVAQQTANAQATAIIQTAQASGPVQATAIAATVAAMAQQTADAQAGAATQAAQASAAQDAAIAATLAVAATQTAAAIPTVTPVPLPTKTPTPSRTPAPPKPPTPTFTPSRQDPYCKVVYPGRDGLNLREGPGTDYPSRTDLHYDDELTPLSRTADRQWLYVNAIGIGLEGFVANRTEWVRCYNVNVGSLPVITFTPPDTPTPTPTPPPPPQESGACTITYSGSDGLNFREGPGTNYKVVGLLQHGDKVRPSGRSADSQWLYGQVEGAGDQGWFMYRPAWVQCGFNIGQLPVKRSTQPPVTVPPPAGSSPGVERITFPAGTASTTRSMTLSSGEERRFVLRVVGGQELRVSGTGDISIRVYGPDGGEMTLTRVPTSGAMGVRVPASADYTIAVRGSGAVQLTIYVPPR